MEQERVTLIIIITTIIVLVFAIAMIAFFAIYHNLKTKLLIDNKNMRDVLNDKLS